MKPYSISTVKLGSGNVVASLKKDYVAEEGGNEAIACEQLADTLEHTAKEIREYALECRSKKR